MWAGSLDSLMHLTYTNKKISYAVLQQCPVITSKEIPLCLPYLNLLLLKETRCCGSWPQTLPSFRFYIGHNSLSETPETHYLFRRETSKFYILGKLEHIYFHINFRNHLFKQKKIILYLTYFKYFI